jgi:alpha-beta hydrolase superfamily lysophospholipase
VGGVELYAQSWRPAQGEVRGVLVVQHGLRDHGDHYAPMAARLVARGYAVYAMDLPGHGRSSGRRVTVGAFDDYVQDFDRIEKAAREKEAGKPIFVFGHSMGGAIVALWAEAHSGEVAGVILSAPALRIDLPPLAAAGIMLAGTLTPNVGGLAPNNDNFSSDPAVTADMGRDPLIFQPAGPVGTAKELVGGIEKFWAHVDELRAPLLLLLHGTGDKLTAPAGSREIYARAGATDKTLRLYPGLFHDLVHEPKGGGEQVVDDIVAWMDAHTGGPATTFPAPDLTQRLNGEGSQPSASVALELDGRRASAAGTTSTWVGGGLSARFLFGGRVAWPVGLDAEILGGTRLSYRASVVPLGVAIVRPSGNVIVLGAGAGVADAGGGASFEMSGSADGELQLGPVRGLGWARLAWLASDDVRVWHFGAAIRLGRNHLLWSTTNAGTGPSLGATLDRAGGVNTYGVVLGLHLWGGR